MKRMRLITVLTATLVVGFYALINFLEVRGVEKDKHLKVGFVYDGDESAPYTNNFIKVQKKNNVSRETLSGMF